MFKLLTRNNLLESISISSSQQQIRNFRFRKPPWLPKAKSKAFRIPPPHSHNYEELNYIKQITSNYWASMRSVYLLFKTVQKFSNKESFQAKEDERIFMEKEQELLKKNELMNDAILKIQLFDEENKLKEKIVQVEKEFKAKLEIEEKYKRIANEKVKKLKEKAKSFIDANNLEFEIEKMLNERHDHNFSIDPYGNYFRNKIQITAKQAFDSKFIPSKNATILEKTS